MIYPFHFKEFSGLVIRIDDVSEIVARDEQIRRIQKLDTIGTLAAGLAHDFNNILGGISGAVSLIKIELPNTPEESLIRAGVETVDESVARASGIVKKLLTLAKKQNMPVTPIELNDVINNIMSICEKSIDKSIKIEINYSGKKAYINGDISQIEQVILNLCINASHAMTIMRSDESQWGGTLKISIYPTAVNDEIYRVYRDIKNTDFYVIEVSDTGIGIEDNLRSKIFDPFFSTKKKDSGTGLGLSMVYNTITQHGGHLILNSEVGKGSTFKLYFPSIDFPDDTQNDIPFKKGTGVILVADNEPAVVHIINKTLTLCGYEVLTAGNGEDAFEIYKNNKVDFVISDSDMPKLSGTDLYWKLKEYNPDVKFVFITGLELNNEMSACIDNGALGLIIKPFNMHSFSNKIYDMINGLDTHVSK
jgi:two-component system, cell cycle sensor histidine kinase and response regulator CckA